MLVDDGVWLARDSVLGELQYIISAILFLLICRQIVRILTRYYESGGGR